MGQARRWSPRAAVGGLAAVTLLATTVATAPQDAPAAAAVSSGRVVQLMFNDDLAAKTPHFDNAGTASLAVSLETRSGGAIRAAKGRVSPARNTAIRTPAFAPGVGGARAVVKVVDVGGADNIDPGNRDFTFGADFTRNANSERAGSYDNGDNLIQRGLFGNQSQFKIQLDHDRASCRIKGSAGVVAVVSPVTITAGRWYRAWCSRSGSKVTLTITRWSARGTAISTRTTDTGPTGSLTPATDSVPLSIGGKLSAAGNILDASDQFNGRIDNAILQFD